MDHEVPDLERCSRLGCSDDFDKRLFAEIRITGTYINVVSKWRVDFWGNNLRVYVAEWEAKIKS
jgi:hypothetical protein